MPINAYQHKRAVPGPTTQTALRKRRPGSSKCAKGKGKGKRGRHSRAPTQWTGVCLCQDELVGALEETRNWARVRTQNGAAGYVLKKHLQFVGKRCRAFPLCRENHTKHTCVVCGGRDTKHRSGDCPKRFKARMFHGTKKIHKDSILANGMKGSPGGRLGPGVYATTSLEAARKVANTFHGAGAGIIVELEVNLGNCRQMWDQEQNNWQEGGKWDSCYAKHPPWLGLDHVREFVIPDATRCKVVGITDA